MFVKKIIDHNGYIGDVVVTDGVYEILCFSHSETIPEPNRKVTYIGAEEPDNILKVESCQYIIKEINYSYFLQGKVIKKGEIETLALSDGYYVYAISQIGIGGLIINLETPLPDNVKEGDFVSFYTYRLNCDFEHKD